jgi:hypothetical protein
MPLSARIELAAGASANIDDLNPCLPGETITVWAAGEAADGVLNCSVGTRNFARGRTGIESTVNAGPKTDENLFGRWTQPPSSGAQDVTITNAGVVVVQIQVIKE